jgi:hypothetical protein
LAELICFLLNLRMPPQKGCAPGPTLQPPTSLSLIHSQVDAARLLSNGSLPNLRRLVLYAEIYVEGEPQSQGTHALGWWTAGSDRPHASVNYPLLRLPSQTNHPNTSNPQIA